MGKEIAAKLITFLNDFNKSILFQSYICTNNIPILIVKIIGVVWVLKKKKYFENFDT